MPRGKYTRHTAKAAAPRAAPTPIIQEAVMPEEPATLQNDAARPDPRPAMRADPRPSDSRAAASARAAEIMGHIGNLDEGTDDFWIDPGMIPDGWSYEWKRHTVYGAPDPAYDVALARTGWAPVPAGRHPAYMPEDYKGRTIERKGMVLMERPAEITERVKDIEYNKATSQMRNKEQQLNQAPPGQFQRDNKGATLTKLKKEYSPVEIPD